MRVIPDQDSRDLAAMCRSVLAAELEAAEQWKTLAEAGVLGLAIDGSLGDVGVFCIEAGRALCPRVVQSTVYAALAIDWLSVGSAWLPRLTSGEARAATALFSPRDAADMPRLQAHRDGDRQRVSGVADFVTDADVADVIVATTDAGLVAVDTTTSGISIEPVAMMGGFPAFTVRFDEVGVDEATPVDAQQLRRVANAIVALDCLDLVGVGEAVIAAHRRVHQDARAVRQADRVVPGGTASGGRHAHRAGRSPAGRAVGGVLDRARPHRHPADGGRQDARRRGQEDHARRAPTTWRHGLRRRHRPASVLRAGPHPVDVRRWCRYRREMA